MNFLKTNIKIIIILFFLLLLIISIFYSLNIKKKYKNIIKEKDNRIDEVSIFYDEKLYNFLSHLNNGNIEFLLKINKHKIINSDKNNKYVFKSFSLPIPNKENFDSKAIGYLEFYKNKIIYISGNGNLFYFDSGTSSEIKFLSINSNIKNFTGKRLNLGGPVSVKDLLVVKDKILVSYTKEVKDNCYNISILEAKINFENMNFNNFFTYDECFDKSYHFPIKSGGRMAKYNNGKILFSIGEFFTHTKISQDKSSLFGKIIEIEINNKKNQIVSLGHRNPLGLYFDEENNIVISTDNGPKGGDEINVDIKPSRDNVKNFGWPISSYGVHIDNEFRPNLPLNKSHKDFGNIEPIKYFENGIGISQIVKLNSLFSKNKNRSYFVSALGYDDSIKNGGRTIHHIELNETFEKLSFEEKIIIGERIRDMIIIDEYVYMTLENTPSIGVLSKKN